MSAVAPVPAATPPLPRARRGVFLPPPPLWAALLLAALAGLLQALSLADWWAGRAHGWLQIGSLAALVWLLARPSLGFWGGFVRGWVFGMAWLAGTFWWLFISMHVYGGLAAPLAVLAVWALAAFLGLYYAVAAGLWVHLWQRAAGRGAAWRAVLAFAALWTLAELARGHWFTGFPWGAGGYAHVDGLLAFSARYGGVYGLGLLAAALAAGLALAARLPWRRWPFWGALVAALGLAFWGHLARHCSVEICASVASRPATMSVALLQGNIPQDEKFVPGKGVLDALRWYGAELADNTASLVVAPETAIPVLPQQLPKSYWAQLQARYQQAEAQPGPLPQAALFGIPLGDYEAGYTNSVMALKPGQATPYTYDKHHLVPFGEFVPPLFAWFVRLMNIPLGDFNRGSVGQPSFEWQGQRLAPNICYEDLFGEELAARFADAAQAPTAFVNVSNIGWFGDGVAIDQHLLISRMRALEFERPMLRATNTGATAIIDHRGRVTHRLPNSQRGVLHGQFEGRSHITPYAAWAARWGLWPLVLLCAALLAAGGLWQRVHAKRAIN